MGRSARWLANMSSNSRNLKSPFLTTRCLYQWGYLMVVMSIWAQTVKVSSHHSWPIDASTRGVPAGCCLNMSSNSRNLKSPFVTKRGLYWGDRSASWLANICSNSRNLKSPFLTIRCLYYKVGLPVDMPIWAPTVEISIHHSSPLDASTGG